MNEEKIAAVASVLSQWNPLGENARNIKDLDGYRVEAADIVFGLKVRGNSGKPERLVMEVLNQAFDLNLTPPELHRARTENLGNHGEGLGRAIRSPQPGSREGLRKSAQPLTFTLCASVPRTKNVDMLVSAEEEIQQVKMKRPHVVILGAGASFAAFPNGDKSGKKLPLMNNFIDILGVESLIKKTGLVFKSNNFEDIYSAIHENPMLSEIRAELEEIVYGYFSSMSLPDEPTLYDHLVLSLRHKDTIATFNWDPFLVQAIERNMGRFNPPMSLYLHGNVKMGACSSNHHMGINGTHCRQCGNEIKPSRLLYPVGEKNYHNDKFIAEQWRMIATELKKAFMVTIFGYGAPTSDASAISLFKTAWGSVDERNMEEFEVIDIRNEDDIRETWSPFIHSHHYSVEQNFYDSWIANHPRRTGEAYLNQFLEVKFIESNPLPRNANFQELWDWYDVLHGYE